MTMEWLFLWFGFCGLWHILRRVDEDRTEYLRRLQRENRELRERLAKRDEE